MSGAFFALFSENLFFLDVSGEKLGALSLAFLELLISEVQAVTGDSFNLVHTHFEFHPACGETFVAHPIARILTSSRVLRVFLDTDG